MKKTRDYLCCDDEKIIRQQIIFGKPHAEIINFMITQFGVHREEANQVYERLASVAHINQKNTRWDK